MKHLKLYESFGPTYSGGDVTKMPIIGTLKTKEFTWGDRIIPGETENVVEIIKDKGMTIYVLDRWNKGRTPQLIHEDMVEEYTPVEEGFFNK